MPISSPNRARPTPFPRHSSETYTPQIPPRWRIFSPSPAKESGHPNQLPIDKCSQNKIVVSRPQAIPDGLQSQGLMLGHRVREGQGLPLQRFVAKLPVGLGIAVSKAANLHDRLAARRAVLQEGVIGLEDGFLDECRNWRRGRDLNPRYPLRYVRFRGGSFQPLTHLSARTTGQVLRAQTALRISARGSDAAQSPQLSRRIVSTTHAPLRKTVVSLQSSVRSPVADN